VTYQVRVRTPFDIVSVDLGTLIALPDPEAAEALNTRIMAWNALDELHGRSYAERGLIAVQFEKRRLWSNLVDPDTGTIFANFTAWMSCSQFLGCRRTNFEAKGDVLLLSDVPSAALVDIKKENIKVLLQLSTAVRNDPEVLEAAKILPHDKFEEKLEREHPHQHIESRKPLRFNPGRSGAKKIEECIAYAIEHGIAGGRDEAVVRMAETALDQWFLEEELRSMPAETTESAVQ
jgi:hypothetical protein